MNILTNILLGIAGLLLAFFTSRGKLYHIYSHKSLFDNITPNGYRCIVVTFGMILLTITNTYHNNLETTAQQARIDSLTDTRNKLMTDQINQGIEKNVARIFDNLSIAMAKQNLAFDSVNLMLLALRDSAKTIVINNPQTKPQIIINENGIKLTKTNKEQSVSITATSHQGGTENLKLVVLCEFTLTDGTKIPYIQNDFFTSRLPIGIPQSNNITLGNGSDISYVFIILKGKYTAINSKIYIPLHDGYVFDTQRKITSVLDKHTVDSLSKKYNL